MVTVQSPIKTIEHYAAVHHKKYDSQPQGNQMGIITNDIKRKGHANLHTMTDLFKAFSSGQSVLLSNFEVDKKNGIRFISSSAFAIDIDDDKEVTIPLQVLEELKGISVGLFYTFSHKTKGNRYRLVFQLDKPITKEDDLKLLIDYMNYYLRDKGLPVDESAPPSTIPIRGGNSGYEVNNMNTMLNTDKWLDKAQEHFAERLRNLEIQRKENAERMKEQLHNPVTFEEMKEMIEAIGHLPSGDSTETTNKWLQVTYALKHQVDMQLLDDDEGYELFHIVSGGESNEKQWQSMKPEGQVSIGTIIYLAEQSGYRRKHKFKYGYALKETIEAIEQERIRVKQYIPVDVATELLQRGQKLLIDSPTGSGKTTAFINAFKGLQSEEHHYYIFATPTIPLTEQVAKEHDLEHVIGGIKNFRNKVTHSINNGNRIFVSTYDKTVELFNYIKNTLRYDPKITIVIDEIHKFSEAYNYRSVAIDRLEKLSLNAHSLIGLSGTQEDVLKDNFDKIIKVDTGNNKSPCTDYRVFTYDTTEDGVTTSENADIMLVPVIRGLLEQSKALIFINNTDRIERIAAMLRNRGIKCTTVTSNEKQSSTYRNIVESGTVDDEIEVILCTTVLADGISIKNSLDWSCVVVSDTTSPIFNPSTIKQISNRFRNTYRYFAIYMLSPNPTYDETRRFNIETDYRYKKHVVNGYVDELNKEYYDEVLKEFIPSNVEKTNGIFYRSTDETAEVEYNPLFVRYQSMKTKEMYYRGRRIAFVNEVSRLLGHKLSGMFNVNDEVRNNGTDLSKLFAEVEAEKEQEKLKSDELRANFTSYFEEETYKAFIHQDNNDELEYFKKHVHADQYAATRKNSRIADFETCKALGQMVKKRADINKYVNNIQALTDIASFEYVKKVTVTKRVFNELIKISNQTYLSSDFKEITEEQLPKKLKVTKKDVKEALKLFHKVSTRPSGQSQTRISQLSIQVMTGTNYIVGDEGEFTYPITNEAVRQSILKNIYGKSKQQQEVLYPAVESMYGIARNEANQIDQFRINY